MFEKLKLAQIFKVFAKNSDEFNMRKTSEELQELSLILTQQLNKPHKDFSNHIIEEIAHVEIRLLYLKDKYCNKKIKEQVNKKIKKLNKNVNNR